jgi:hypothetical protein
MPEFKFTTRSVILLGQLMPYIQNELHDILGVFQQGLRLKAGTPVEEIMESIDISHIAGTILRTVGSIAQAEDLLIELVSHGTSKSVDEIQAMDGFDFIKLTKEYFAQIDWKKFMGECLGLKLSLPESKPEMPQS